MFDRRTGEVRCAEQSPCDMGDLDLVGAPVDLEHLGIAGELLDMAVGHVARTTEHLHRVQRNPKCLAGRVELHRRGFGQARLGTGIDSVDVVEDEVLDVQASDLHERQLVLDELEVPDRLPELHPVAGMLDTDLQATFDDPEGHRRNARSLGRERGLGAVSASRCGRNRRRGGSPAQQAILLYIDVVEEQFARGRRVQAHLA